MRRYSGLFALLLGMVLVVPLVGQDEKDKDKDKEPPRLTGRLPLNYSKVGLTDAQKQAIFKIQAKYNAQLEQLKEQIRKLQDERKADLLKVLTPAQQARLKEIQDKEKSP